MVIIAVSIAFLFGLIFIILMNETQKDTIIDQLLKISDFQGVSMKQKKM